jgi:DNA-binding CsgD family transcriptional regulator
VDGGRPSPGGSADRLIGRGEDLSLVHTFLGEAADHGGALVLVGEAGVGKSVMLEAAAAHAAAAGTLVLRTTGLEFLPQLSFATLHPLLVPLRRSFGDLVAVHRDALAVALGLDTRGSSDRLIVYNAVLDLLHQASTDRPLLAVVDDLQWADSATAALLSFVARRLSGTRAGLLVVVRPGAGSAFSPAGLPQQTLAPLGDADAAALIRARSPRLGPRAVRLLLSQAQGNPLALVELPRFLGTAQRQSPSPILPLSRRLQAVFGGRVANLPPATRRLLLLAALEAGGDLEVLGRATGGGAGLADLAPAERAHLVTVDDGGRRVTFRHPLVRSTVVEISAVADRSAAHRALAEVLTAEPDRRLWHLAEATPHPDEAVAGPLEQLAHLLRRRGDAVGAFTALLRSADLSPDDSARSRRLAEAAYLAADVTGELRTAVALLVEARRADPAVRGSLRAAVAAAYLSLNADGDVGTAHRLLVDAIQGVRAGAEADELTLTEAVHTLLEVCLYGAWAELWPAFHDAIARLPSPLPPMLRLLVGVLAGFAHLTAADIAALEEAVDRLGTEADPTRIERIATAALFLDRASGCREALWRTIEDGRNGGAVASAINAMMVLCIEDFMTGQWEESASLADEGLRLCEAHGYRLLRWPFRFGQALLAAVRGDEVRLAELVREIDDWAGPRGIRAVQHYARHASALAALGRGDADQAFRDAATVCPPGHLPFGVPNALWVGMDLVEAAVRSGRRSAADAHVVALHEHGIAALSPRQALLTTASAAIAAPDHHAGELYERALRTPRADHWPFELARVHLAYGDHLRRARDAAAARSHLGAALATFRRLGAHPWAARAAEALRAAGESGPGVRPEVTAAPALTAQERAVVLLAAAGLTNKEIGARLGMSHRTVASHLHRVFPRLGVTSRVALRDALSTLPANDHPTA